MRVVVTGGLGFIGHKVVNLLEDQGHEVTIIDNKSVFNLVEKQVHDNLVAYRKQFVKTENIYYTSVCDEWATAGAITEFKPDAVIHLAGAPNQRAVMNDSQQATRVMSTGLINVLESSKKASAKRFVYISSSMVYGSFDQATNEDAHVDPTNQYGVWKLAGELLVKTLTANYMDYTIIRPSGVYGPGDLNYRVIPTFTRGALTNDTIEVRGRNQKVDFTHVDDVANGIVLSAVSEKAANNTYNISSGKASSLMDAALFFVKHTGQGVINLKDADLDQPTRNALSYQKAQEHFGYEPQIAFEDGLLNYLNWYKERLT